MAEDQVIVVAVEDSATAGVVAAAAQLAMDRDAVSVVLVHVLENHAVASGMYAVAGIMTPAAETTEQGEQVLAVADMVLRGVRGPRQTRPHGDPRTRRGRGGRGDRPGRP